MRSLPAGGADDRSRAAANRGYARDRRGARDRDRACAEAVVLADARSAVRDEGTADLLSATWAHRAWSERCAANHYRRLAEALRATPFASFAPDYARASDDELRHADLCERTCLERGGAPFTEPTADPPLAIVDERALVLELAVTGLGETLNVVLLHDELVTAPEFAAVTRVLLRDERRHARLGWAVLDAAQTRADLGWLAQPIGEAFGEAHARGDGAADLMPARRAEVLAAGLELVIAPALARIGISAPLCACSTSPTR